MCALKEGVLCEVGQRGRTDGGGDIIEGAGLLAVTGRCGGTLLRFRSGIAVGIAMRSRVVGRVQPLEWVERSLGGDGIGVVK